MSRRGGSPRQVSPARATEAAADIRLDRIAFGLLAIAAFVFHLSLASTRGWERDQYWFHTWMQVASESGAAHVPERVWCDYPPVYLYVLEVVGRGWTALTGLPLPPDGSLAAHRLLRFPTALATIATAALLFEATRARRPCVVVVEARGDLFSAPAKEGVTRNLTRTDSTFERDPAWSPDGKWLAYFSDASGEYELWVRPADAKARPIPVSSTSP